MASRSVFVLWLHHSLGKQPIAGGIAGRYAGRQLFVFHHQVLTAAGNLVVPGFKFTGILY